MTVLRPEVITEIERIEKALVVAGIPSFRNQKTIAHVVKVIGQGLAHYFPHERTVLIVSDGGSEEDTRETALSTPVPPSVAKIVTPYLGLPGKGSAFHTIFEAADRLKAKVVLVFDADLQSITPEWVWKLAQPIYHHPYGFVTPYYLRYKYDGTITNNITFPLTTALYGLKIRQPIGGDFALSGALAKIYSHQDVYNTDIARFGIDIWMTTLAVVEGFRVAQASLGVKLHDPKDPASDLVPMLHQVTGTLFELMLPYEASWKATKGSKPADLFGSADILSEIEGFEIDEKTYIEKAKDLFYEEQKVLKNVLSPPVYFRLKKVIDQDLPDFHLPIDLWAYLLYELATAYHFSYYSKKEILNALTPLYFARIASGVKELKYLNTSLAEALIQGYATVFEQLKAHLVQAWEKAKGKEHKKNNLSG